MALHSSGDNEGPWPPGCDVKQLWAIGDEEMPETREQLTTHPKKAGSEQTRGRG